MRFTHLKLESWRNFTHVDVALTERVFVVGANASGKSNLDRAMTGYARAAKGAPFGVLRDLDQDAACAPSWLERHAPRAAGEFFTLRLAVRAVEAWVLADVETVAAALHVPPGRLPIAPDSKEDPELTIVDLPRRSPKRAIRRAWVPASGASRRIGPGYEAWLIELGCGGWSVGAAAQRSPSLSRARAALERLGERWERRLVGGGDGSR